MNSRLATVTHPVHELVAARHSPRAFAARPVDAATLRSLFEAARWAPSAGNEQPWRFLVATAAEPEAHNAVAELLEPGNRRWAVAAPVLFLGVARLVRGDGGKANPHARYDLGQALAWLSLEATARGLVLHQMAGFDAERARSVAAVPAEFEVVVAVALGYPGDPAGLPEELRARELAPRSRRSQAELVFGLRWGEPR